MMLTFAAIALQAPAGGSFPSFFIIQIVLILGIFYFLILRPQQKQRKKHEETLGALKKGDEIVTAGGLVGRVVHIQAQGGEGAPAGGATDRVTIESGTSRLVVERGRIARVGGTTTAGAGV